MNDFEQALLEKANILVEALPYIRKFYGKTFVIKYGGAAQKEPELKQAFAQDIVLLNFIGINPVVVHGGGPKITELMKKLGKNPTFIHGHRVTDKETIEIVEMVLGGVINKEIVQLINSHGGKAVGLTGKDGNLLKTTKKNIKINNEEIDLGFVGEIEEVCVDVLESLQNRGFIPVIAPIGFDKKGQSYNINADTVASAIAVAVKAEKLILLTDVKGISDENNNLISTLNNEDAIKFIEAEIISGGMIPKVYACLNALKGNVRKTHIIDGRIPHSLLLEIFTKKGVGTEIVL
ncbi:MAG TPA: acetylglutamate kinase [Thermodesulfovibrio thiophilus]|uniref:acetylglutamate kinase n=1 Tax=Thermodesulfovibrio thiophilus TaxID=340095 RepID=UPI001825A7E2|nr:acetylglutamate kinase [Thermodesulfovibrio thiophilus]HHW20067.1 acetylglutamate kinase [Thermodesulfovibrio thiophilus]HOA83340.1 acetylglutamate kinase [Thermodesulfovibrio thiophilus]HQA04071.1 acetylglutamate kinase [Thermodesulfovibrio thiophilus]HQD36012.1 acetylglutamate kinase [Thermodesulfovibrio thiophilus]